jgi:hypothetical protein
LWPGAARAIQFAAFSTLLTTLVWGGCISCERYFTLGSSHGCCTPDGHCKRNAPAQKGSSGRECKQIAFNKQKGIEIHFDLPAVFVDRLAFSLPGFQTLLQWSDTVPPDSSPPDLQVLNSIFLV